MSAEELQRMQHIQRVRDMDARARQIAAFLLLLGSPTTGRTTSSHEAGGTQDVVLRHAREPRARGTFASGESS